MPRRLAIIPSAIRPTARLRPWPKSGPLGIVFHSTDGSSVDSAISQNNIDRYAYQYIIDRNGSITQFVPDGMASNHAGVSGPNHHGLSNDNMIGVAFVGDTNDYTPAQMQAARELASQLHVKYPSIQTVLGHGEYSRGRKDPKDENEAIDIANAVREDFQSRPDLRLDAAEINPFDNPGFPSDISSPSLEMNPVWGEAVGQLGNREGMTPMENAEASTDIESAISLGMSPSFFENASGPNQPYYNPSSPNDFGEVNAQGTRLPEPDIWNAVTIGESRVPMASASGSPDIFSIINSGSTDLMDSAFFNWGDNAGSFSGNVTSPETWSTPSHEDSSFFSWDNPESFDVPSTGQSYSPSGPEVDNLDSLNTYSTEDPGSMWTGENSIGNFGGDLSLGEDLNSGLTPSRPSMPSQPRSIQPRPIHIGDSTSHDTQIGTASAPAFGRGADSGRHYYNVGNGWVPYEQSYGGNFHDIPGEHNLGGGFLGIDPNTGRPIYNPRGYGQFPGTIGNNQYYDWGSGGVRNLHESFTARTPSSMNPGRGETSLSHNAGVNDRLASDMGGSAYGYRPDMPNNFSVGGMRLDDEGGFEQVSWNRVGQDRSLRTPQTEAWDLYNNLVSTNRAPQLSYEQFIQSHFPGG